MIRKEKGGIFVLFVLGMGSVVMISAIIAHGMAETNGWQFRNGIIVAAQTFFNVYVAALITCLYWLLVHLEAGSQRTTVDHIRIFLISLGIMVFFWFMPSSCGFNFVTYGFGHRIEKEVIIDGVAYIERSEQIHGLDIDAVSYHKQINDFLYEKAGWGEYYSEN
ncbi:MAG: hypothetical protein IKU83_02825 [Lachnospiraceae bacterium]|nr:hypothetical protein [Lachnospiraceae bacterium]